MAIQEQIQQLLPYGDQTRKESLDPTMRKVVAEMFDRMVELSQLADKLDAEVEAMRKLLGQ